MPARKPPRYVPTLTEVVAQAGSAGPVADAQAQQQLIERIMQRVDMSLERRMREAIAAAVLEQTQALAPLLRDEIELAVRETVAQAFAEEAHAAAKTRS